MLHTIIADSAFVDGSTILIKPSATPYPTNATLGFASIAKNVTIWGYGATLQANTTGTAKYMMRVETAGKRLTIYGLTMDLNYPTVNIAGAIRVNVVSSDGSGVATDGLRMYNCTLKNPYDFGVNVGVNTYSTEVTRLIFENCSFINPAGLAHVTPSLRQSLDEMICVDSVGHLSIRNCYFHNNKFMYVSARNIHVENVWGDANGFDNIPDGSAVHGENITFRNVYAKDSGYKFRNYSDVHQDFNYATCKRLIVDGFTYEGTVNKPIQLMPWNDTTNRMETVTLSNLNLSTVGICCEPLVRGVGGAAVVNHAKIDTLTIQDCVLQAFDSNNHLLLVKNCDIDNVFIRNVKFGASWSSTGSPIRMNTTTPVNSNPGGNVTLGMVDMQGLITEPPVATGFLVTVVDDNTSGRTATATFRRSLDNGLTNTRLVTAGSTTVDVKFRENSGTGTVASGSTSTTITHNLRYTPNVQDIILTATNDLGSATNLFVSGTPGATTFVVGVDAAPGGSGATFAWKVRRN